MDNESHSISPDNHNQRDLSIAFTASSMINASDMITAEAYQANMKRIQEVKEMVRTLEVNNEVAHKNFVINELEKRAKEGRDAEEVLVRMKNTSGLPSMVQFTNHPNAQQDVILPSTATVIEVPEGSPSYSPPAPVGTFHPPPQTIQQHAPQHLQWSVQPQQAGPSHTQAYPSPDRTFQSYAPHLANRQPSQHSTVPPQSQIPVDPGSQQGQNILRIHGYAQQNPPGPQGQPFYHPLAWPTVTTQTWQLPQSWTNYAQAPQDISHQNTAVVNGPRYTTQSAGLYNSQQAMMGTLSSGSRAGAWPSEPAPHSSTQINISQASSANVQNQSRNLPLQVSGQPTFSSHSRPHHPTGAPQQVVFQPPRQLPQHPPQHPPQQHPPQQPPHVPIRPPSTGGPSTLKSVFVPQAPQAQPSQVPKTQSTNPPSQVTQTKPVPQSISSQDQGSQPTVQAGHRASILKAAFVQEFQKCVKLGPQQLKDFYIKAYAAGVAKEWLEAAINTIPRQIWESVLTQIRQMGPPPDLRPPTVVSQPNVSAISMPTAPVVSSAPLPSTRPPVQTTPAIQRPANAGVGGKQINEPLGIIHSMQGQPLITYAMAAQMKFYADEATKAALAAQGVKIPVAPLGTAPPTLTTPGRTTSQTKVSLRTPDQADKSRLARDILRSLGRTVPKLGQDNTGEPGNEANKQEEEEDEAATGQPPLQPPAEAILSVVPAASLKPLAPTNSVFSESSSVPPTAPVSSVEQLHVSPEPSTVPQGDLIPPEQAPDIAEGPITIDLTLDDSDESVAQDGLKTTFPIQTAAVIMSHPASPTKTITHMPQLESLSLAETCVDAETGAPNVDVRMESPPLLLTGVVEDSEFELTYPPPGILGSTPLSSKAPSREASEHVSSSKLPLFLPSPLASPAMLDRSPATEPPVSDHDVIIEDDENNWSLKRRSVEVDSMEVGAESVSPPRARKRRRQQVYVLVPPPPPLVKKIIEKMKMKEREMAEAMVSGSEIEEEDDELRYNQLEQRVIEESKSRLMERRCRWLNCEAILNCTNNLLAHLKKHASEESPQAPLLCHWAGCRRKIHTIEERDVHLERHAVLPLPCPLAGCNEEFDRPIEVMQHEVQHQDDGRSLVHKPTSEPFVPPMPARLGQPPRYLPSYRVLPRRILKSRISADRHAVMGPWVLWNIFSPVDLNMRKQNATMRGRPTRQGSNYNTKDLDARHDDYDFLVPLTSHSAKVPALDDLNSDLVTQLASRGLTLWGPQPPLHNPAESPPSAEPQNDESAPLAVNIAMSDSATGEGNTTLIDVEGNTTISDVVTPPSRNIATEPTTSQLIGATGEEEAVERMLIL